MQMMLDEIKSAKAAAQEGRSEELVSAEFNEMMQTYEKLAI